MSRTFSIGDRASSAVGGFISVGYSRMVTLRINGMRDLRKGEELSGIEGAIDVGFFCRIEPLRGLDTAIETRFRDDETKIHLDNIGRV